MKSFVEVPWEKLAIVEDLSDCVAGKRVVGDFSLLVVDVERFSDILRPADPEEHFVRLPDPISLRNVLDDLPDDIFVLVDDTVDWLLDDPLDYFFDVLGHFGGDGLFDDLYLGDFNDALLFDDSHFTGRGILVLGEVPDDG